MTTKKETAKRYYRVYRKLVDVFMETDRVALFSCLMKPRGTDHLAPVNKEDRWHVALERRAFVPLWMMRETPQEAVEAHVQQCERAVRDAESRLRRVKQFLKEAKAFRKEVREREEEKET